jgi:hypothetical protein
MAIKHGLLVVGLSAPVTTQATGLSTILRRLSGWTYFDQQSGCSFRALAAVKMARRSPGRRRHAKVHNYGFK